MVPCDHCECIHWDSDKWGGHCMLALPDIKRNQYTGNRYCADYKLEVKPPKKRQNKKTSE